MIDGQGRTIDYIRISVTDRCNLRCVYCMPEGGIDSVPHEEVLRYQEIIKLSELFSKAGIRKIKLTGGEPLVRKGLPELAGELKRLPGIEQVTLTTNGVLLSEQLSRLTEAGIDGINLSLDTLNPEVYARITRGGNLGKVMDGFYKTLEEGRIPLKINCVPMGLPGQNAEELANLAKEHPVHVRFIEMMPIGLGRQYKGVLEEELLLKLEDCFGEAVPCKERLGNGPGHYVSFPGFEGKIGFISAVSHKFCHLCNRVRLTSQGFLKTCLQYERGVDLKKLLREGASEEVILEAVSQAVAKKPVSHQFEQEGTGEREWRTMSQIGG